MRSKEALVNELNMLRLKNERMEKQIIEKEKVLQKILALPDDVINVKLKDIPPIKNNNRVFNRLHRNGVDDVYTLLSLSKKDQDMMRGIGEKSRIMLAKSLSSYFNTQIDL